MLLDDIKLPIQQRSKQRLEKVLEITILLIEEKGVEHCTIPEIALRANVPKTYIYQYFPTMNHIFILLAQRYLEQLQTNLLQQSQKYEKLSMYLMIKELISRASYFYHQHKVASILILGGPVHLDGFNLQEVMIEEISAQVLILISKNQQPIFFEKPEQMTYLVEMVFALMKHSFYKYQKITQEIQDEALNICDLYLQDKGHQIH